MEIIHVESVYFGERCSEIEKIEQEIEFNLYELENKEESIIYTEKEIKSVKEADEARIIFSPLIIINGEMKNTTEIFKCNVCSKKYKTDVYHYSYNKKEKSISLNEINLKSAETVRNMIIENNVSKKCSCSCKEECSKNRNFV